MMIVMVITLTCSCVTVQSMFAAVEAVLVVLVEYFNSSCSGGCGCSCGCSCSCLRGCSYDSCACICACSHDTTRTLVVVLTAFVVATIILLII